jgi:hypothetical protein
LRERRGLPEGGHGVGEPQPPRLVLDEMFSPTIGVTLRERKHDVIAVAERVELRSMTDDGVFAWAVADGRWLLTENVRDFRPILLRAMQAGGIITGVLFTNSRTFPRSRQNLGPLIEALNAWLSTGPPPAPLSEDWLLDPGPVQTTDEPE